jgi:hypothetical protein
MTAKRVRMWCAAALAFLIAAPSFAQTVDRRTLFTFSGPVAVPGVTLPAGTYMFRLAIPEHRVVQVLSADGSKPYATFFSIPAERFEPADQPEVRFMETAANAPAAIRSWWYPGQRIGYEFIYPKEQARRLAMGNREPVLTTRAETTTVAETDTTELARVSPSGEQANVDASANPVAAAPTGVSQEGQLASSAIAVPEVTLPLGQPAPAAANESARSARTRLPQTASALPLVALLGTLSLMGAAAIRYWRHGRLISDASAAPKDEQAR